MCVAYVAYGAHPDLALVVAMNRDELYRRSAEPLARRRTAAGTSFIGGVDRASGGTWFGTTAEGRFALLTNCQGGRPRLRPEQAIASGEVSRGTIPTEFLDSDVDAREFATMLMERASRYRAFNLIVGDLAGAVWVTNCPTSTMRVLDVGYHGVASSDVDSSWPKVSKGVDDFRDVVDRDFDMDSSIQYFDMLRDGRRRWRWVRTRWRESLSMFIFSARFVRLWAYGTRCSTVAKFHVDGRVCVHERRFTWRGGLAGCSSVRLHRDLRDGGDQR